MVAAAQRAWWTELDGVAVTLVAKYLGLRVTPARGASGGTISPCPACASEKRHTKSHDRRGAIGVRRDQRGARCFQCDTSFTAFSLVAYVICGGPWKSLNDAQRDRVHDWVAAWAVGAPERREPVRAAAPAPLEYPPADELRWLWQCAVPVTDVPEVARWLGVERRIDPSVVATMDLARALPYRAKPLPAWAHLGREGWWDTGHRLLVPLVDGRGVMRSMIARSVAGSERKSVAPRGFARTGLVMADRLGREMLAGAAVPADSDGRVIVTEGEPDFLVAATQTQIESDRLPAVLGIVQGAWSAELAARVPSGATVVIATHGDAAGERYAQRIREAFGKRGVSGAVRIERWHS